MATEEDHPKQSPPSEITAGECGNSQIAQFFENRVVFVTGATGFIGKVLLEKLLRSCPGVKRIYVLVRSKLGEEPQTRMEALLNMPVFDRLKEEKPGALTKIKVVAGDLSLPNLGLSDLDQAALVDEVSVVFHSGATVRFNEPLKRAVDINVLGTMAVLNLCRKMPKMCALVHLSTAYSNWSKKEVHEIVYPSPVDAQRIIEGTRCVDEKTAEDMSEFFFGQPNNYALTKAVTESMLLDERGTLPMAIVRPSIVTASWKEPSPGWVDNYNGCTGIVASLGMGLAPSVNAKTKSLADLMPVDVVANMLIGVAWEIATTRPSYLKVYNCTAAAFQQHTWGEVTRQVRRVVVQYPLPNARFFPSFVVHSNHLLHAVIFFILGYLPACIGDLALLFTKRKPNLADRYNKVRKSIDAVQFYTTNSWLFRSGNVVGLIKDLSPTDKQVFNFDIRKMNWHLYWDHYMVGIRKYLFRAEDAQLNEARKHLKRLYALRWFMNLLVAVGLFHLVTKHTGWEVFCLMQTHALALWEVLSAKWPL